MSFGIFVQFADGTNSTSHDRPYLLNILKHLSISCAADVTLPVYYAQGCPLRGSLDTLPDNACGLILDVVTIRTEIWIIIGLRFEPYRDGLVTLALEWDYLTISDAELQHEECLNVFFISVVGSPPPVVIDLMPRTDLRRTGGELLTVIMDNVIGSNLRFLKIGTTICLEVTGSWHIRPDGQYEALYLTQPGNGTNLPWSFQVSYPEGISKTAKMLTLELHFSISYSTTVLEITSLVPLTGTGGELCVLKGYFDGFKPTDTRHQVYIGSKTLSQLHISVSINEKGTEMRFTMPTRAILGAAYQYKISVTIGTETTNAVIFTFRMNSVLMRIAVYGASYDPVEDVHVIGGCDVARFIASLPSGVPDPNSFKWNVKSLTHSLSDKSMLDGSSVSNDTKTFLIFPTMFGNSDGKIEITVACVVHDEQVVTSIIIRNQVKPIIGLSLPKILPRSISIPDVPLRLTAVVMIPRTDCYNQSAKVAYEWTYENETQVFSYRNHSEHSLFAFSSPGKLGREFVIPQSRLAWGNWTVSLRAYMEDDSEIYGRASTSFEITAAPLVPIIGFGASKILHSVMSDLIISAERSIDPDGIYIRNSTKVEAYEWSCIIYEAIHNETSSKQCGHQFLPHKQKGSFTIKKSFLASTRDALLAEGKEGTFFIRYSVVVSVGTRISAPGVQIVEVSAENFDIAVLDNLQVLDNRGKLVRWLSVPYYEDVLVAPYGPGLSWSFEIISPASSMFILKQPDNLILHPGYYDPNLPSISQSLPLGVKAGTFSPSETYEIEITTTSSTPGVEKGRARITLKTQDEPFLILPELPITEGDLETTFTAFARVNLDSSYSFLYYFFLIRDDGDEYCLDGCSGSNYVQFKNTEAGTFRVVVRLMDMQGKTLFDEASFTSNITVSEKSYEVSVLSSGTAISAFSEALRLIYHQGDHGTLELFVSSLSNRVKNEDVAAYSEDDVQVLDLAVDAMHQVVQNAAPTTMTSKSYVRTAARFASMTEDYFSTQETMYTLFSLVDKAIKQIPLTESFDLQEELLLFYNLSTRQVISTLSGSSTRVRLQRFGASSGLDARSLLIDMYRLQEEHLTTVLSRDAECGFVKHLTTIVSEGVAPGDVNRVGEERQSMKAVSRSQQETFDFLSNYERVDTKPTYSSFSLAVACNSDQASQLIGEATIFQWCNEVFSRSATSSVAASSNIDPNQKHVFTVMETLDYTWLSGVIGEEAQSDTKFLVTTNVTAMQNDAKLSLPDIPQCYTLNTTMSRLGVTAARGCLSAKAFTVQELGQPFEPKVLLKHLRRNFSAIQANMSTDGSSTIIITSSGPGVFGAIGTECPIRTLKPTLSLPYGENTDFLYIVFGGVVVALVGVTIAWIATSTAFEVYAGAAGAGAA